MIWKQSPPPNVPAELLDFTGDTLLAQLLAQRGITTVAQARAFLDPHNYEPAPSSDLPDMTNAVDRINRAIKQQELICVWGDFDVDGQTSTALLVSALTDLGAHVISYIPNRLTESHGIKIPALQKILTKDVNLLLTCDTGITEYEAVKTAHAAGVDVIITDHHDLGDTLPKAEAVINPKRLPADHSLRELPGVGVAYKLAESLYKSHKRADDVETLLDLVALGIVADVAQQTGDTRYLLQKGLVVLQNTPRAGLQALLENARLTTTHLTEEHIGFWLAPRLNALGRLGDANLAVELLTTDDRARARIIALQLEALNDRRKILVDRVVVQALGQIEDAPSLAEYNAVVLASSEWHPGVVGIAANRLVDQYGKPAILIALRPDGLGRGSARSVPGCDIHQAIKRQSHLLTSFGGHPMAAGLAIQPDNITEFRRGLSTELMDCEINTEKSVTINAMVTLPQISSELLQSIQRLAPFGAGNPPVHLGCRGLHVVKDATFGKTAAHKRLTVADENGIEQNIIWWSGAQERTPQGPFDLAFTLTADSYRGGDAIQITWLNGREWESPPTTVPAEFIDWRTAANASSQIATLTHPLVWAEGVNIPNITAHPRHKLCPADTLVVWTAPPGQDIFRQALAAVRPQQIYLVGHPSPFDTFPTFIKQLMGLVKYALTNQAGEINVAHLTAALGHRETVARLGVDWLAAQGKVTIEDESEETLTLSPCQTTPNENVSILEETLKTALAETAAYRAFFKTTNTTSLKTEISTTA